MIFFPKAFAFCCGDSLLWPPLSTFLFLSSWQSLWRRWAPQSDEFKKEEKGQNKKGKTETTNQKEQLGEDELNDVGTNVVTLDEEVRDPLLLHSLAWQRLLVHIHQVLASNGRGAGMHVNPLEQVFVFTSLVLTISELLLHIYFVLFYPAPRSGRSLGLFMHLLLGSK